MTLEITLHEDAPGGGYAEWEMWREWPETGDLHVSSMHFSSSTGDVSIPACRLCGKPEHGSLGCHIAPGWPAPVDMQIARLEPYFVYERIAAALERIADCLERQE